MKETLCFWQNLKYSLTDHLQKILTDSLYMIVLGHNMIQTDLHFSGHSTECNIDLFHLSNYIDLVQ